MLTFAPMNVSVTDAYSTLSFTELQNRLAERGLHEKIGSALAAGGLTAFVQLDGDHRFYRVPLEHWNRPNPFLEGEPGDQLFCWGSSNVPVKFHDRPLLFFLNEVEDWEADGAGDNQTAPDQDWVSKEMRGDLPPSAKPNDRQFEEAAHSAAQIVREHKLLPAAAFRQVRSNSEVMPDTKNREPESILRAIRKAYDLMYDRSGMPHQN